MTTFLAGLALIVFIGLALLAIVRAGIRRQERCRCLTCRPPDLAAAADETRRFRNRAARAYDNFDPTKVTPTIDAADELARRLPSAIAAFRQAIDPPP